MTPESGPWPLRRAKYLYRVVDVRADSDQRPLLSVSIHHGAVPRESLTDDMPRAEDLSNYKLCETGDVVVNRMRAFQGAIGITDRPGLVSPEYMVLRARPEVEPRFLHHLFRSHWFVGEMISRLRGIGATGQGNVRTPRINAEDLGQIEIALPPQAKQRTIADYLDAESARIDALITMKWRMIELLEERVECMIRRRIAESALVGSEPGRTSTRVKRVLTKLDRPAVSGSEMVTAFRDGQVTARSSRRPDGYTESGSDDPALQGVRMGDVVVHGLDGFAGAIGTSDADGACSPVYHVCVPRRGGDPIYLGRLLRILATSGYLGLFASSTRERAVDFRNWELFARIPIPDVSHTEQQEIGDAIRRISPLKVAVNRSAQLASEYRQALVTGVVTGRVRVPDVAA